MTITVKQKDATVQNGTYPATLINVKKYNNAFGGKIRFTYLLNDKGITVTQSTTGRLSIHSKLAIILSGLLSRDLTPREIKQGINPRKLIGTRCNVLVMKGRDRSGHTYNNVERVFR